MKKDLNWLKSAIQQNLDFYNDKDEEWQMAKVRAYAKSLDLINQLDETEDLSKEMKQSDLILYLDELETMTKQLVEGLQVKHMRDSLDRRSEAYLEGKLIEKKRLLFIIKDVKSLYNTEK